MGVIARQSIKGALANYLGVAIGFVTTFFVLTNCLTQEEIGLTRVMVDAAMLFSSLAQLGTSSAMVRFFPFFKDGDRNHGIFGLSILFPLAGFLLVGLLMLLFRGPLVEVYAEKSPLMANYFYMVPMLTFFAMYLTVFETNASVLMRISVPKLVREVGVRLFNLVAYLLYGLGVIGLDLFVWLFCGSYALAMLLALVYLMRLGRISFRVDREGLPPGILRQMLGYALFMTVVTLAGNVPLLGSLFLGAQEGLQLTGVYTIAFYIANLVDIPYRSLGAIARPVVATAVREGNWREVNRLARQVSLHQLLASTLILFFICVNLDALFAVIPHGADFAGGARVVLLLGLARVVNSSLSIASDVLNFSPRYRWALFFSLLLTGAALWLNPWLIGRWGIDGSGAATLLAYAVYYSLLLLFIKVRLQVSLFSMAQLKVVGIVAALVAVNALWNVAVHPLFGNGLVGLLADAVLRTLGLGVLAVVALYRGRVSDEVCSIVDKLMGKNKR